MTRKHLICIALFSLLSSGLFTLAAEQQALAASGTKDQKAAAKEDKGERLDVAEPKPGDIKVLDGVEYIYTKNKKYMLTPYEPEYVWIRKDQYVPGLGETVMSAMTGSSKKEREELEARIAKLEEDYKKKGINPQMALPVQMAAMPTQAAPAQPASPKFAFTYPSPQMKRRVVVLPVVDRTGSRQGERLGELATVRLVSRLESTNALISTDPAKLDLKGDLTEKQNMKALNQLYGVEAVIRSTLSEGVTPSSLAKGRAATQLILSVEVYDTETGALMKQFSGRGSLQAPGRESERAGAAPIDASVEMISEDLMRTVLTIDWHARVASLEGGKVYINAGRLSGLEKGSVLEVYAPGQEIVDGTTKISLGMTKGRYKGQLKVAELFGIDACSATQIGSGSLSPTDLVYLRKD